MEVIMLAAEQSWKPVSSERLVSKNGELNEMEKGRSLGGVLLNKIPLFLQLEKLELQLPVSGFPKNTDLDILTFSRQNAATLNFKEKF